MIVECHKRIGNFIEALFRILFINTEWDVFLQKSKIDKFLQWTRQIGRRFIASCSNLGKTVCASTYIRHDRRSLDNILDIILKQFYRLLIKSSIYRKDIAPQGIIKRTSIFPQFPITRHTAPYGVLFDGIHRIKTQSLLNIQQTYRRKPHYLISTTIKRCSRIKKEPIHHILR